MKYKFITEEKLNNFVQNVESKESISTVEYIKKTEDLQWIFYNRKFSTNEEMLRFLEVAEIFLYLFEEAEEFEYCATLLNTWPELKR